jgi:hypothetical protein
MATDPVVDEFDALVEKTRSRMRSRRLELEQAGIRLPRPSSSSEPGSARPKPAGSNQAQRKNSDDRDNAALNRKELAYGPNYVSLSPSESSCVSPHLSFLSRSQGRRQFATRTASTMSTQDADHKTTSRTPSSRAVLTSACFELSSTDK